MKYVRPASRKTLPAWLFILLTALYDELLIHFWITDAPDPGRVLALTAFALGFGAVLGLIVSLIPSARAGKWTAVVFAVLLAVVYMTEYFVNDSYQCFMTIPAILNGAGGVATDFFSLALDLVLQEMWRIVVILLPIAAFAIWGRPGTVRWRTRGILAGAALVLYLAGFGTVHFITGDAGMLSETYHFDSSLRTFGINMALTLDVVNGGGEQEAETDFELEVLPEPTFETEPAETQDVPAEETEPQEIVYAENVLPIDFVKAAEDMKSSNIAKLHKYVASVKPSLQNEYTGLFEGKNLIIITAESFAAEVIDPELTPTLYRMANEGIKFTDYYQPLWGGSTSAGEFSHLWGLAPEASTTGIMEVAEQDLFLTMGNQLQKQGYFSRAYHNHTFTFYSRHLTHTHFGYEKFIGMGNGLEKGVTKIWPQSDLELFEFTVEDYIDQQPFSIYYMTVSGHCRYTKDGNAMTRKNFEAVEHLDCSERIKGYFACNLEVEYALQHLLTRLEEEGIADDTVVVLTTDHYPYGLQKSSAWGNDKDYVTELYGYPVTNNAERDHNALIIWSGCLEDMDLVVDTPVYSLDILPTLSNLFGLEYDSRLLIGRDVFSDQSPLVLWNDYSWLNEQGYYDAAKKTFTPAEGQEKPDQDYIDYMNTLVRNKITYSRNVAWNNYFNYVAKLLPAE